MPDDFCLEHGYEFMTCKKVWGAVPYCKACDDERQAEDDANEAADNGRSNEGPAT